MYNREVEDKMVLYFSSLNEKDQRHYAAVEAIKLGFGGQKYLSKLFGISPFRIRSGIKELNDAGLLGEIPTGKQRRPGGGRKKKRVAPLM